MQAYYDEIESSVEKPSLNNLKLFVADELKQAFERFDDYLSEQFFGTINPDNKGSLNDFKKEVTFMKKFENIKQEYLGELVQKSSSKYSQFYNIYLDKPMSREEYGIIKDMFLQSEINNWLDEKTPVQNPTIERIISA